MCGQGTLFPLMESGRIQFNTYRFPAKILPATTLLRVGLTFPLCPFLFHHVNTLLPAMPSSFPVWSRVLQITLMAGMGTLTWWALSVGAEAGRASGQPVTRALRGSAPAPPPGGPGEKAAPAELPARGQITDEEYGEIIGRLVGYGLRSEEDDLDPGIAACMDSVVARLGFSARAMELERDLSFSRGADYTTKALYDAVRRALRGPEGASLRAELVTRVMDPDVFPWHEGALLSWCVYAGETAPPAEHDRLLDALRENKEAFMALHRGRERARMAEAPVDVMGAALLEWMYAAVADDFQQSAGEGGGGLFGGRGGGQDGQPPAPRTSPFQNAEWRQIAELAGRVPLGADYVALDALFTSLPANGEAGAPGREKIESARASMLTPWALADPAAAVAWLSSRPGGLDELLVYAIQNGITAKNPKALAAWVNTFPPGCLRDRLAEGAVMTLAPLDPAAARPLAAGIGREDVRGWALSLLESPSAPPVPDTPPAGGKPGS